MFLEDEGIQIVHFGEGDVKIAVGLLVDGDIVGGIAFCPCEPGEIDRRFPEDIGKQDVELGVKVRIVFHDLHSLDALISACCELRELMMVERGEQ